MLDRLLRPAWQNASPDRRLQSIATLDPLKVEQATILATLANTDPSTPVRLAAMEKLAEPALIASASASGLEGAAELLRRLLAVPDLCSLAKLTAFADSADEDWLRELCLRCPSAEIRHRALARTVSAAVLVDIGGASEFADTRAAAAERIEDIDQLELLWRTVRNRDKNLAHLLRVRIDDIHRIESRREEVRKISAQLLNDLETLQKSVWSPQYNARFLRIVGQWQELEGEIADDMRSRYRDLAILVEAEVLAHRAVLDVLERQPRLVAEAEELAQQISVLDRAQIEASLQKADLIKREWLDMSAVRMAESPLQERIEQFIQYCSSTRDLLAGLDEDDATNTASGMEQRLALLRKLDKSLRWPSHWATPIPLTTLRDAITEIESQLSAQKARQKADIEAVETKIKALAKTIQRGNLPAARSMEAKLAKRVQHIPSPHQEKLLAQLDAAREKLQSMIDWKEFAIQPKFIELCEQMESLIATPDAPDDLAKRIQLLQEAWKALRAQAPEDVWQRFQDAGHRAFEPCKLWFAEQDRLRETNLAARENLVTELQKMAETLTGEPDFKNLRTRLRQLRNDWRTLDAVPSGPGMKVGRRYGQLTRQIQAALDDQFSANKARKRQLVEAAEALAALESVDATAIKQMQALQQEWKGVGIVEARDEKHLWERFRLAGDKLFGLQREQDKQQRAAEGQARAEAKAKVVEQGRRAKEAYDRVYQLAEQFARIERMDTSSRAAEIEQLGSELDTAELASDFADVLRQRLIALQSGWGSDKQRQESGENRRILCIRAEVLLGIESPPQDRELRLQYQMRTLAEKGLGTASSNRQNALRALEQEYLRMGATDEQEQKLLDQRWRELMTRSRSGDPS